MARSELAQPVAVTLDRYRRLMHVPFCAFNGIDNPDESKYGCDTIWTQAMRDEVASALHDAGEMLAHELRYTLGYEYQVDTDHRYVNPLILKWGHIVGGGTRAGDEVTEVAEDFTTDPATITVAQTDFSGGTSEIVLIETSTGLEIEWDSVASVGANYVVSINQCKLIEWDDLEFQRDSITYDAAFPATIWLKLADLTIYREYRDVSDQATIIYGPQCQCAFTSGAACSGAAYDGCVYVTDFEISQISVQAATYSSETEAWSHSSLYLRGCYEGDRCSINYLAGTRSEPGYERAVRALAHSLMAMAPCGCDLVSGIWQYDHTIPERITPFQAECMFGQGNGAWFAWNWAQLHKLGEAYMGGGRIF